MVASPLIEHIIYHILSDYYLILTIFCRTYYNMIRCRKIWLINALTRKPSDRRTLRVSGQLDPTIA